MSDKGFHHRSAYTKSNKPFKGKSKAKATRSQAEKPRRLSVKSRSPLSDGSAKSNRLSQSRQVRDNKRQEILRQKRLGTGKSCPLNLVLLPLGNNTDLDSVYELLFPERAQDPVGSNHRQHHRLVHTLQTEIFSTKPYRVTVYKCPRERLAALDACKTADIVIAVLSASGCDTPDLDSDSVGADDFTYDMGAMLKAQGLPSLVCVSQHLEALPNKRKLPATRIVKRFFQTAFGDQKVMSCDTETDGQQLWRYLQNLKVNPPQLRENRPYLVAETLNWRPSPGQDGGQPPEKLLGTLSLCGFLRGNRALSADHWVHLTGFGDFAIGSIDEIQASASVDQVSKDRRRSRAASRAAGMDMDEEAMPAVQTSISRIASCTPAQETDDLLLPEESTETHIADDELLDANAFSRHPAAVGGGGGGMELEEKDDERSAMQRVWDDLEDSEDEAEAAGGFAAGGDDDDDQEEDDDTQQQLPAGLARNRRDSVLTEAPSMMGGGISAAQRAALDSNQARLLLERGLKVKDPSELSVAEKEKLEQDETQWPDEQDTPRDFPAREYFAQYRGLKSFRASPWDPFVNLPPSYSRIFRMENSDLMRRRILEFENARGNIPLSLDGAAAADGPQGDDGGGMELAGEEEEEVRAVESVAFPGQDRRIIVNLNNVPLAVANSMRDTLSPLLLWGLLRYEHKVSVLHFQVKRTPEHEDPIMNGEPMVFDTGFRRFTAAPIYSHFTQDNKHKLYKFFHAGSFAVASVFAPITFPPGPVLMFKANGGGGGGSSSGGQPKWDGETPLVATGSLLSIDPQRMSIERVVLTGYPINTHKKTAVIRYMFWNPEDIRWFKPFELWTKDGLRGHVKEPRGTKGYMKCIFDGHIKSSDTVCMSLYKRVYPPFNPEALQQQLRPQGMISDRQQQQQQQQQQ